MTEIFYSVAHRKDPGRRAIAEYHRADEARVVTENLGLAVLPEMETRRAGERARFLVEGMRANRRRIGGLDRFLQTYGLSTKEGVALMCLAEALLRIPDSATKDRMIRDKLLSVDWERHTELGGDAFVNASTWALMLTGRVLRLDNGDVGAPRTFLERLIARAGEPVIREALLHAMQIMGKQFVLGRTIDEALIRARAPERTHQRFSFDMLGEAARTRADAQAYMDKYPPAIAKIVRFFDGGTIAAAPGISVKLSGLHPRSEFPHRDLCVPILIRAVQELARLCREAGIGLALDAEEADRLDILLDVFEAVARDPALGDWGGFGLAVQAYQKRAVRVVEWLEHLARDAGKSLMVRLVKGAYWDSEIKRAQERGLDGYPVFTRKASTDVAYQACARHLLKCRGVLYPQFATHNALTVASVLEMAGDAGGFEFQRLHGMGGPLYHRLAEHAPEVPVRVYAPVGNHEELLPYLVRRLLENGSNTSFVNRIESDEQPIESVIRDPVSVVRGWAEAAHPRIPLPRDLFGANRVNSRGIDFADGLEIETLYGELETAWCRTWEAAPLAGGTATDGDAKIITDPADRRRVVGKVLEATFDHVDQAVATASKAFRDWNNVPVDVRANALERAAGLFEAKRVDLMALIVAEASRTLADALSEVREAADFLRFYASEARKLMAEPAFLSGYTGETNHLVLKGRGVFACISPWNFPLAIFTGQIAAALVTGNTVVSKPARQTPLVGALAVRLFRQAGVPGDVLHYLPGADTLGARLVADERLAGVCFTGSTATARKIHRALAAGEGPIPVLIAETGGQNAMIVDSTALPEQVVDDVLTSGFRSAGQRCSSLRVLFLQNVIADRVRTMLAGAAEELIVGDPRFLKTDVGPVIDDDARMMLEDHTARISACGSEIARTPMGPETGNGIFFAPRAFEIDNLDRLTKEVFGPIVHVVRFSGDRLDAVVDAVNATGYGLTLGIHSRIDTTARRIAERARVGNVYVNRNMIGAIVGVQPFGGQGLSGTGPKAGGPYYLLRFVTEQALSINTAAIGGNTELVSLDDGT